MSSIAEAAAVPATGAPAAVLGRLHAVLDEFAARPDAEHGVTDIDNGCLLRAVHHRLVHEGNIPIRERNGYLEFLIPPLRPLQIYDSDLLTGSDPDDDPEGGVVGCEQVGALDQGRHRHVAPAFVRGAGR